ncbi:MAG: cupin domain-containing protein [Deltaproteobacteria bacterium]|nr:cupin domain-containing protein [Deltaproteobacteria bacterium]
MARDTRWQEPKDENTKAGYGRFLRPKTPYEIFMEEQEIPIYRGIGVRRVQDLPLKPWKRIGGNGTFIQLFGTEDLWGCYLVEVPGSGALERERHVYEEIYLVVEGRGTTEVWVDENRKKITFEWQRGSLFSIPLNAWHRIINATSSSALLLAGTTAPPILNLIADPRFVFNCPYHFEDRFNLADDYYRYNDVVEPDPVRGLAMRRTNIIPDIINCNLPLDNRRSPGTRRIEPHMTGNKFYLFVEEHETGRYTKAHAHKSAAVLICLRGKGYTYTWPYTLGITPWKDGIGGEVKRQDYEPVGMVSAAPMGGNWFHQHFGVSREPLRLTGWFGPVAPWSLFQDLALQVAGPPTTRYRGNLAAQNRRTGEELIDFTGIDLKDGGSAIPYREEDPFIRQEFEAALRREGIASRMDESFFR